MEIIAMLSLVSTTPLRAMDQLLTPVGEVKIVSAIFLERDSVRTMSFSSPSSTVSVIPGSEYLYSTSSSFWRFCMTLSTTALSLTRISASAVDGITFLLVPPLMEAIRKEGILLRALPRILMEFALSLWISPPLCPPQRPETLMSTVSPSAFSQ